MRNLTILAAVVLGVAILFLSTPQSLQAQARTGDQEVDTLLDRIKAARARQDRDTSDQSGKTDKTDETKKGVDLSTPDERKAKLKAKEGTEEKAEVPPKKRERTETPLVTNPNELRKSMGEVPRTTRQELLAPRGPESETDKLLGRIRASHSEAEKAKAKQENAETPAIGAESKPLELRNPPAAEVGSPRRFVSPLTDMSDTIGADVVAGAGARKAASTPAGVGQAPPNAGTSTTPDPVTDPDRYQKLLKDDFGAKAQLPQYADQGLLRTYEADRFKSALQDQRDVRIQADHSNLADVYGAYKTFQSLPLPDRSLGRQDTYIPNSQNFLSSTYRGSIYELPYSTDPYRRNYSTNSTDSRYSNNAYFNLNTVDAFNNYRSREYGYGPRQADVPTFSAQVFDVNTLKQWAGDYQRNYGVDVPTGVMTYGDMYRLHTTRPGLGR